MEIILHQKNTMTAPRLDYKNVYNVFLEDFEIFHDDHLIIVEIVKKYILHGWITVDD